MIKAIIFDFDGVIAESVEIKTKSFARLFEHEGDVVVKRVVDYHLSNAGISRFEKFRYIYREILNRDLTDGTFKDLCRQFSELVVDEVVNAPYVKGAKEFLDSCALKYNCYIASATPHEEIEEIVRRRGISQYFKAVYGAPKKKTDIVTTVLSDYALISENVVYVGDALSDYEAARENNIAFIARLTSNNETLFKNIDCIKINDFRNLQSIITAI